VQYFSPWGNLLLCVGVPLVFDSLEALKDKNKIPTMLPAYLQYNLVNTGSGNEDAF